MTGQPPAFTKRIAPAFVGDATARPAAAGTHRSTQTAKLQSPLN
jgi:hypothetical protein